VTKPGRRASDGGDRADGDAPRRCTARVTPTVVTGRPQERSFGEAPAT
jgi:hypothetical protein